MQSIKGNIVEIGVLTGAFFGLLHHFRRPDEVTIGIDCYAENLMPPSVVRPDGWLASLEGLAREWIEKNSPGLEGAVLMNRDRRTIQPSELQSLGQISPFPY